MGTGERRRIVGRIGLLWLIVTLVGLAVPSAGQAQEAASTSYEYTFGQQATFNLWLPASSMAQEATLFLRIDEDLTRAYTAPVDDGRATYTRALREVPWPPFATITYWWEYNGQTTARARFLYEDNRFRWQTRQEGGITVHWVDGDAALMVNALDIARNARREIESTLQAPPLDTLSIYIYPSSPDLQSALRLAGREWVAGQAYPDLGVILLAIPPTEGAVLRMRRDIPHELTHQIHYNLVGDQGYAGQPEWLVEGLASHFETTPDPVYAVTLNEARETGQLIEMTTLCYPFPDDRGRALLAYAQSQSFVNYLQRTYGWATMRSLIHAYADGLDCSAGVEQTLGMSLPALDRAWRVWLERTAQGYAEPWSATAMVMLRDLAPWLTLLALTLLPGAIFVVLTRLGR